MRGERLEEALIERAKAGDQLAYSELVDLYLRRVYRAAYSVVRNVEDASDVAQETFVRAFRSLDRFDPNRPFYPWLYRIARNLCINLVTRRRDPEQSIDDSFGVVAEEPNPEQRAIRRELAEEVRNAVDRLPEIYRQIIELQHFQECSYAEIAEILGIPMGTVMSRLYHARRRLREMLEQEEEAS